MQAFLVFPHQLYADLTKQQKTSVMFLFEDSDAFQPGGLAAPAIFQRAALQAVRERLLVKGFAVRYMGINEYPSLDKAIEKMATEHPEVVRFYELSDKRMQKYVEDSLMYWKLPFISLPSPVKPIKKVRIQGFVPVAFPPVEPNRYVEGAALYYGNFVPITQEVEFAYPVTRGDAEEWLELLPELMGKVDGRIVLRDLAPLVENGLVDRKDLDQHIGLTPYIQ